MERFTLQQRLEMIRRFYNKTYTSLRETCDWDSYPSEQEIRRLVKKFETTGSILDEPSQSHARTDAVVLAEAQTNGTKKSTNRKRAGSKAPEQIETDEASEVEVNSTTVKKSKSSKGAKKETKKAETKSKGTKRKAAIKEDIPEDDVLPENEFTPEVLEEATKAKKPIKSKGSQKQLKEVEPVLVEEDASNQDDQEEQEEESLGEKKTKRRKTAVNKAASKKVPSKKAAKGKKDTVVETEPEAEAHTAQELDADIEASEIQVNGSVPNKAEPEKKAGRGRKRATDTPLDEADGAKVATTESLLNPTITDYNESSFKMEKDFKLKISSWNIAGLRSWLKKDGLRYLEYEQPDILCLQEIKCTPDQVPEEARIPGYHPYWLCMPGGHAGVAVYSKIMPIHVEYGIGDAEQDLVGRLITAEYEKFYLVCVYVPNSGRKLVNLEKRLEWEELFRNYVQRLDKVKPVVIAGDMNVSHKEIDLANPKTNTKNAGFTPEERDAMTKFLELGYVDTFRCLHPDEKGAYTFWSYMGKSRSKNVGWRLDYFIISERAVPKVVDSTIRSQVLGSDHCPITLFLNI